jgi:hypothetical protein
MAGFVGRTLHCCTFTVCVGQPALHRSMLGPGMIHAMSKCTLEEQLQRASLALSGPRCGLGVEDACGVYSSCLDAWMIAFAWAD